MALSTESIHIPLNVDTLTGEEIERAISVLKSGRYTMGRECQQFEDEFSSYLNVKHSVLVNSGSSANLLAAFALASPLLGKRQDRRQFVKDAEIIVPALTWPTTIWPIVQAGGIPVFVDIDPLTLQMDLNQVEEAISDKTVAIFAVHVLGNATPVDQLRTVADQYGLWLVEDTCESLGVKNNNQFVGTVGDIGTFSFYFSHHITTIEGGMVVTNDDELADIIRCLRAHGWTRNMRHAKQIENTYPHIDPRFLFIAAGFNVRSTEINAAIGRVQLPKLAHYNEGRNSVVNTWLHDLAGYIGNELSPMRITPTTLPAWFGFPVKCKDRAVRNALQNHLENSGIETRPVICGNMLRQPALQNIKYRSVHPVLVHADAVMDRGLYWGCHPMMANDEINYVSTTVKEFYEK